jgi:branched-chain amino acid transport system ATP-binding protein
VIDAYLGSHQDVDLGVVTGRIEGIIPESASDLVEELQEFDKATAKKDEKGAR